MASTVPSATSSGIAPDERNLTRNQQMVLDLLVAARSPLSAYDILDRLRSEGLRAPPQVYRALDRLQSLALVHRVESLNAFLACVEPHAHDDDHAAVVLAVCNDCHSVTEISSQRLRRRLVGLSEQCAMDPNGLTIELRGHCAVCRPKTA